MSDQVGAIRYLSQPTNATAWWSLYGLDEIWQMVRDEDGVATYTQIGAWQRMADLCSEQADQLQRALDQLMLHWPPTPGSAAEQFKLVVNDLIFSMRGSTAEAAATKQPLSDITMELGRAKDEIGQLVTHGKQFAQQEQTLSTRGVYPGRGATVPVPPSDQIPPDGWRQSLDQKARQVMATTDANIGAVVPRMPVLTPYELKPARNEFGGPIGGGGLGGQHVAAVLQPTFDPLSPFAPSIGDPMDSSEAHLVRGPILAGGETGSGRLIDNDASLTSFNLGVPRVSGSQFTTPLTPGGMVTLGVGPSAIAGESNGRSETGALSAKGGSANGPMMAPSSRGYSRTLAGKGIAIGGRRRRRSDPSDPWTAPAGGPSTLEPPEEFVIHDPGPGVIGIDR